MDGKYIENLSLEDPLFKPYVPKKGESKLGIRPFFAWEYFKDKDYMQYYLCYILNNRSSTLYYNLSLNRFVYEVYRWGTKYGFDPAIWRTGPQDFVPPISFYHNPQEWWEELSTLLPIANFGIYVKLLRTGQ